MSGDINVIVLDGRLAMEPEIKTFDSGGTRLKILVTIRSENPHRRVDVIPVTYFGERSEVSGFTRGDRVWLTGSVQRSFRESPDGRHSRLSVIASQLHMRKVEEE